MLLSYVSLVILLCGLTLVFYGFIWVHDLPYSVAKKRHHPQAEAIHVACWLSLFTLHAIWPIVYIWAVSKQAPLDVAVKGTGEPQPASDRLAQIEARLARLEKREAVGISPGRDPE